MWVVAKFAQDSDVPVTRDILSEQVVYDAVAEISIHLYSLSERSSGKVQIPFAIPPNIPDQNSDILSFLITRHTQNSEAFSSFAQHT